MSPTLTIDDESDPGAWAIEIAHTPRLAAQCAQIPVDALRVDPPAEEPEHGIA